MSAAPLLLAAGVSALTRLVLPAGVAARLTLTARLVLSPGLVLCPGLTLTAGLTLSARPRPSGIVLRPASGVTRESLAAGLPRQRLTSGPLTALLRRLSLAVLGVRLLRPLAIPLITHG
ncbi:hypothetical protein GCM10011492_16980 [Flexivirga endophytica]|uniref:Uncharacterized protein n=1 Tax=Flexivirga endophytica TaxID=1849103 RepID=A0A916T2F0_9MICO|nr:hypothetical protein GCM10011492_16980 [Flexivirga endophytica]GHB55746.1 hypothetical protein GCM10008112_26290 [Flexivirga endophytica]